MNKLNRFILLFAFCFLHFAFFMLSGVEAHAQAPQSFNYQLIARDTAGLVLSNHGLGIKISILQNSVAGAVVFSERHSATTNLYGLVNIAIGTGTVLSGSFQPIDWGTHLHYIKLEIDPAGGTNYFTLGITQLVSVPYALYAEKAGSFADPDVASKWTQEGDNIYNNNSGNVGIGTSTPSGKLIVKGDSLAPANEPLFEVKNKNGEPVFVVYPDSVHIYVNDGGGAKATSQGGFAVSGRSSSKGTVSDYLVITPDSTRIYLDESPDKATSQGGFAVSGRSSSKSKPVEYFRVTGDSIRMYIDSLPAGPSGKGGFAVGSYNSANYTNKYLKVSPDTISASCVINPACGVAFADGSFITTKPELSISSLGDSLYLSGSNSILLPVPAKIVTSPVSNVTSNSADGGGNVTTDGGAAITDRGVCWSTIPHPEVSVGAAINQTSNGTGAGAFTSSITGLMANTTYYVRAYAISSQGITYGDDVVFTTGGPTLPVVTTDTITDITQTTATGGGTITNNGGVQITARGVCWSTDPNPDTTGNHNTDGTGTGSFISSMTGLSVYTLYYVRAYAVNSAGIAYGNEISFTTTAYLPTVMTNSVSSITDTSATSGGLITDYGGATVTAYGVCWSTTPNPVVTDSHTIDFGTGSYVSYITGLNSNTTYYIRAYATNCAGTGYGNEVSFTTLAACGNAITDARDGKLYNTVQIGTQCWMAQNLNVGTMISSTGAGQLQTDNAVIEKYCYNNISDSCNTYGGLYEWREMMQYAASDASNPGTTQGICPAGWHLPTDAEWTALNDYLGGTGVAGGKMKETGTTHWYDPNTSADNSSGFTALPSGFRYFNDGSFYYSGNSGYFWSATENNSSNAWFRSLNYDSADVYQSYDYKEYGFSVRCLKD